MEDVRNWLRSFGLSQYAPQLEEDGWDKLQDLFEIDNHDLTSCIHKPGHRKRFGLAVTESKTMENQSTTSIRINISSQITVGDDTEEVTMHPKTKNVEKWLKRHGLGQYISNYMKDGWDIPEVLCLMEPDDIGACIHKPGHRKKFELALKETNFEKTNLLEEEITVEPDASGNPTGIETWLKTKDLERYIAEFEEDGWDTKELLSAMTDEDIKRCIDKPGHRKRFQLAIEEDVRTKKETSDLSARGNDQEELRNTKYVTGFDDRLCQNDSEVPFCQGGSVKALELETTAGNQIHEQDKVLETSLSDPVRFGLDSTEDESTSSDITKLEETYHESDDSESEASSVEDFGKEQLSIVGTRDSLKRVVSMPPSLLTISKASTVLLGGFQKCSVPVAEDGKSRDNFKKQMKTALDCYKEKDSLYVETNAFAELEQIVEARHWAVIIGVPGDGKTAMAAHLSLKYAKKGYKHLELHFARDWKDWVDGSSEEGRGKKQFVLIDDIFGRMSIDQRKVSEWASIIDLMQRVVRKRAGRLIVVCTSRKYVFNDVKTILARFHSFQKSAVVDMTEGRIALTDKEKSSIWIKYAERYNVQTKMPDCKSTPHGFPHCVDLFATNVFLQKKGISFFDNPMHEVCRELTNFKTNDRIKYCVLLLVLFHSNKLPETDLDVISCDSLEMTRIAAAAGLNYQPSKIDLKNALDGLKNTYISERENCYSISHDSIRENLAFIFIEQSPKKAIDIMDFEYLTDHTRCHGQEADDKSKIYILKPYYNTHLVERMIKEIKNGNVVTVCAHQAWNNSDFIAEFTHSVLDKRGKEDVTAYQRNISDIFNTKDSSTSYIFDFSLFDALRFFGHRDAVKQIAENKNLEEHLKSSGGIVTGLDVGEIPTDLCYDNDLSKCISQIMDEIGASQVLKEFQVNSAISMEVLDTICTYIADQQFSCYIFGSHSEGTRIKTHIPKLASDVNYLFCRYDREVIQNISEVRSTQKVEYLLAVKDEITKPGYVKLQIVKDGVPQTKAHLGENMPSDTTLDYKNRVVVYKKRPEKIHVDEVSGAETTTKIVTGHKLETYHSYRCRTWPYEATKWFHRIRHQHWPSRSTIEQMKSLGCFLVPVGYAESIDRNLEWKMSFLLQERLLMSTLNHTQYKCYIILKMINNDIISYLVEHPVLVSYHLKTCMFYVVENTLDDLWKPENLLDCVQVCLKCILQWTVEGICPNYFIPEENLFLGRIHGELQTKLRNVLTKLITSTYYFFPRIKCGNLGAHLEKKITRKSYNVIPENNLIPDKIRLYLKVAKYIALVKMRILCKYSGQGLALPKCVDSHLADINELRAGLDVTEHSKEQIKQSIDLVVPYIKLSFMSNLIVHMRKMDKEEEKLKHAVLSRSWHELSVLSDKFSAKLKQATFLHRLGYSNASLEIVNSLSVDCTSAMISVCGCEYHHIIVDKEITRVAEKMSEPDFRKNYCMPCVAFLPTEGSLIPDALEYEMKRPSERTSVSDSAQCHFWYDWAVIDSKVLLYYLLYLNHTALTMSHEAREDIKLLENVIQNDVNLGHKETGWNILGWIYRKEGNEDKARDCFQESLQLHSTYNAANLLLSELIQ